MNLTDKFKKEPKLFLLGSIQLLVNFILILLILPFLIPVLIIELFLS